MHAATIRVNKVGQLKCPILLFLLRWKPYTNESGGKRLWSSTIILKKLVTVAAQHCLCTKYESDRNITVQLVFEPTVP